MKKLHEQLKRVEQARREIQRNEELKIEAGNDLKLAATPGTTVAESRKKILDARLTIDLCDAKEAALFEALVNARAELLEMTKHAAVRFNSIIYDRRDQTKGKLFAALGEALGSVQAVNSFMNQGGGLVEEAASHSFHAAIFNTLLFMRDPRHLQWSEENCARLFIAHVDRHAAAFGIDPERLTDAPPEIAAPV